MESEQVVERMDPHIGSVQHEVADAELAPMLLLLLENVMSTRLRGGSNAISYACLVIWSLGSGAKSLMQGCVYGTSYVLLQDVMSTLLRGGRATQAGYPTVEPRPSQECWSQKSGQTN